MTLARAASGTLAGGSGSVVVSAEGSTTLSYFATDNFGGKETAKTLTIKIDKTPPQLTCSPTPSTLWPPNDTFVPVKVNVTLADTNGSGATSYTLVSMSSNEGAIATEQRGFTVGTASTSGALESRRLGTGSGRVYTLTYQATDVAGNTATCVAKVLVPHDQGN